MRRPKAAAAGVLVCELVLLMRRLPLMDVGGRAKVRRLEPPLTARLLELQLLLLVLQLLLLLLLMAEVMLMVRLLRLLGRVHVGPPVVVGAEAVVVVETTRRVGARRDPRLGGRRRRATKGLLGGGGSGVGGGSCADVRGNIRSGARAMMHYIEWLLDAARAAQFELSS